MIERLLLVCHPDDEPRLVSALVIVQAEGVVRSAALAEWGIPYVPGAEITGLRVSPVVPRGRLLLLDADRVEADEP